ncbi:hypothetical protein [Rhodopila globiformis]|uniref:hypothetical protein n=1 Tax=Rhodopila globiformis TaxID=1071 RepID=UPI0011B02234|nr:hypothetical protein [Rhodopila globiformis]
MNANERKWPGGETDLRTYCRPRADRCQGARLRFSRLLPGSGWAVKRLTTPKSNKSHLGFFQFVHNARRRGKALLGALVGRLVG